jgi:Dehydrogenases with different specificities (related to short-chain alcohol dehydrogenases)
MKNILITGGMSGIGLATALELHNSQTNVIVIGQNKEKNNRIQEKYPFLTVLSANLSNINEIEKVTQKIKNDFGKIDVFFANAGYGIFKPFEQITESDFDASVDLNYKGTFFTIQKILPLLNPGSSIIINTSWTYQRGLYASTLYSSTKSAISYLVKSLALELAERKIRINSISPGYTNTEQFNESNIESIQLGSMLRHVPMNRFGEASEIAKVVSFLASDSSSYVNGQEIIVDGGLTSVHVD